MKTGEKMIRLCGEHTSKYPSLMGEYSLGKVIQIVEKSKCVDCKSENDENEKP